MSERRRLGSARQSGQKTTVVEKENINDVSKYSKILAGSNYNRVGCTSYSSMDFDDRKSRGTDRKSRSPIRRAPLRLYFNDSKSNVSSIREQTSIGFTRKYEFFENLTSLQKVNSKSEVNSKIPRPRTSSTHQFETNVEQNSTKKSNKTIVRDSAPGSGKGYVGPTNKSSISCFCKRRVIPLNVVKHVSTQTEVAESLSSASSSSNSKCGVTQIESAPLKKIFLRDRSLSPNAVTKHRSKSVDNVDPVTLSNNCKSNLTKLSNSTTCKLVNGSRLDPRKLHSVGRMTSKEKRDRETPCSNEYLLNSISSHKGILDKDRFRSRSAHRRANSASATKCSSTNTESNKLNEEANKIETKVQEEQEQNRESANLDLSPTLLYNVTYMVDLISVERDKERQSVGLPLDFITKKAIDVNLRESVIAFLICVTTQCHYSSPVLYQAVKIFDRSMDHFPVDLNETKIIALSALWISLKKDSVCSKIPSAKALTTFYNDNSESVKKLLQYERRILDKLNFNLTFSDPFSLLIYYLITCNIKLSRCDGTITKVYYCGGYVIDLTLLDIDFAQIPAFVLALVAAELSLSVVMDSESDPLFPRWSIWREKCVSGLQRQLISSGFDEKDLDDMRTMMLRKILQSTRSDSNGEVVRAKYTRSRYGGIANFLIGKVEKIAERKRLIV